MHIIFLTPAAILSKKCALAESLPSDRDLGEKGLPE